MSALSTKTLIIFTFLLIPVLGFAKSSSSKPLGTYEFSKAELEYKFAHLSFIKSFQKWAKADENRLVGKDDVLVIGSSSITGWRSIAKDLAPIKVIHRGFGGSRMVDVLAYKKFFRRYKAKRIVIYEGDNDLGGSYKLDPNAFIKQCKEFVDYIREESPDTKFYFVSIKPSTGRMKKWPKMKEGNKLLKALADSDKQISYIDIASKMLNEKEEIRPELIRKDRVHMSKAGYAIWISAFKTTLSGE